MLKGIQDANTRSLRNIQIDDLCAEQFTKWMVYSWLIQKQIYATN